MKKYLNIALFILLAVVGTQSVRAQETVDSLEFLQKAGVGNLFEINASQLALEKAQREDVREFARMMIADHSAAAGEMASVATQAGFDPTSIPDALDPKHSALITGLETASVDEFDRQYIRVQKDAHDEAIDLFQAYMNTGDNMALREFAAATLPVLRQHREQVYQFTEVAYNPDALEGNQ